MYQKLSRMTHSCKGKVSEESEPATLPSSKRELLNTRRRGWRGDVILEYFRMIYASMVMMMPMDVNGL